MYCKRLSLLAAALTAWLGFEVTGSDSLAEGPRQAPPSSDSAGARPEPGTGSGRDPFATTERMRKVAQELEATREAEERKLAEASRAAAPEFSVADKAPPIPKIQLRGFAEDGFQEALAIIEVEGSGVFLVRQDDTISIQHQRENVVLKVKSLSNMSVYIEVGTLGHVIVVR